MSRDAYVGGTRSPRGVRLPTVDRSPSRGAYPGGSPLGRKPLRQTRSGNNSPEHGYGYHHSSPYYRDEDLGSPMLEERGRPMTVGPGHHRSRSATRPSNPMSVRYQSLDRGPTMDHEREFLPIRDRRDRSLDRGLYFDDEPYTSSFTSRSARQSPTSHQPFIGELQHQNSDLQRDLANLKKELELTNQKLGSSMHSIKTFWSPELKKERALRKEESAKYSLINDQLKLLSSENQKQAMLVRQLEEELRMRMRGPSIEIQQQMEALFQENEHLTREIAILRDTIKELELRIETQKQTLQARDESIKKLLEMLQNKGMGKEEERQMFQQMQAMAQKQLDEFRVEIQRRDQEILAMGAKMKTLEEQHQDYQRHIAVLKESLCAKEEHYNMLQTDVEELRQRLEEKNRYAEKKAQQFQQERARAAAEMAEMREHMDIKDRKINVLQRKLELQDAHKRATDMRTQKPTEDHIAERKQMAEERKMIEEAKKQFEEHRRIIENKSRQVEEKERALAELDKQLQKQKQQLDQLQNSLQRAGGGNAAAVGELNKKLVEAEKKMEQAQEEAKRSATEMERLLQLVQMSQEEQNAKEKQISDLQQALKNAQAKLKQQQQQAQQEEHENSMRDINVDSNVMQMVSTLQALQQSKLENGEDYFKQLELALKSYEVALEKSEASRKKLESSLIELTESKEQSNKIDENYVKQLESTLRSYKLTLEETKYENQVLESTLKEKEDTITELENNLKNTNDQMQIEIENKESVLSTFEKQIKSIKDHEYEKDGDVLLEKDARIQELECALRESIKISTEREMVLIQEEKKRQQIMQKVYKLEQRLLSLQSAQALRCHSCKPYVSRMTTLETKLAELISVRRKNLQELAHMKREALEAAISEKDAHLALLEISGIRSAHQAEEVDRLNLDKRRLLEKLKKEAELSVSIDEELNEDYELPISLISNEEIDQT